jgi:hypothetical protein
MYHLFSANARLITAYDAVIKAVIRRIEPTDHAKRQSDQACSSAAGE